jgi:hypothetical protein
MTTPEEHWAKVRAAPGFADQAAGKNIKLPPQDPPEVRALALLRGALAGNPALAPIVSALADLVKRPNPEGTTHD